MATHFGLQQKCPLCRSHLRTFHPLGLDFPVLAEKSVVGGGYREKARCPVCGSSDRERLIFLYLTRKTDLFRQPRKLLHVAPETRLAEFLRSRPSLNYLSADLRGRNAMARTDITALPFKDEHFDVIICNHVLEHIVDDEKAMSELFRVLNTGGWAILQVPLSLTLDETYEDFSITSTTGREAAFGQADHVRIYSMDYANRLEGAGFRVSTFQWSAEPDLFGGARNPFGLNENEAIFVAHKD